MGGEQSTKQKSPVQIDLETAIEMRTLRSEIASLQKALMDIMQVCYNSHTERTKRVMEIAGAALRGQAK